MDGSVFAGDRPGRWPFQLSVGLCPAQHETWGRSDSRRGNDLLHLWRQPIQRHGHSRRFPPCCRVRPHARHGSRAGARRQRAASVGEDGIANDREVGGGQQLGRANDLGGSGSLGGLHPYQHRAAARRAAHAGLDAGRGQHAGLQLGGAGGALLRPNPICRRFTSMLVGVARHVPHPHFGKHHPEVGRKSADCHFPRADANVRGLPAFALRRVLPLNRHGDGAEAAAGSMAYGQTSYTVGVRQGNRMCVLPWA